MFNHPFQHLGVLLNTCFGVVYPLMTFRSDSIFQNWQNRNLMSLTLYLPDVHKQP